VIHCENASDSKSYGESNSANGSHYQCDNESKSTDDSAEREKDYRAALPA
jgi:hypothetical protein